MLRLMFRMTLAACLALVLGSVSASAQCELTPGFDNFITVTEGDIEATFATDAIAYGPDETVQIELIVKNIGAAATVISWQTNPPDHFYVKAMECTDIFECSDFSFFSHRHD